MTAVRAAFSLVELIVVLAILAMLAALVAPVASQVLGQARSAACQRNLSQLSAWALIYAQDWRGVLPNHAATTNVPDPDWYSNLTGTGTTSYWYTKIDSVRPQEQHGNGLMCPQASVSLYPRQKNTSSMLFCYDYGINRHLGGRRFINNQHHLEVPTLSNLNSHTFWFADAIMQYAYGGFYPNAEVAASPAYMEPWCWRGPAGVGGASSGGNWLPAPSSHPRWAANFVFGDGHVESLNYEDVSAMSPTYLKKTFQGKIWP